MSRIQVVAKGILQGAFVYALGVMLKQPRQWLVNSDRALTIAVYTGLAVGVLWLLFRIVGSRSLVRGIDDDTMPPSVGEAKRLAVMTLRLSCVFWGLLLLAGSTFEFTETVRLMWRFFPSARAWFTGIFNSPDVLDMTHFMIPLVHLLRLVFLGWVFYLLCGAPMFVRWRAEAIVRAGCVSYAERSDDE